MTAGQSSERPVESVAGQPSDTGRVEAAARAMYHHETPNAYPSAPPHPDEQEAYVHLARAALAAADAVEQPLAARVTALANKWERRTAFPVTKEEVAAELRALLAEVSDAPTIEQARAEEREQPNLLRHIGQARADLMVMELAEILADVYYESTAGLDERSDAEHFVRVARRVTNRFGAVRADQGSRIAGALEAEITNDPDDEHTDNIYDHAARIARSTTTQEAPDA